MSTSERKPQNPLPTGASPAVYQPILREQEPRIRLERGRLAWKNGLVVRATNWLGDTLMTLPAMHKLRMLVPDPCGFFVLCPKGLAPVWQAAPWVSEVIPLAGRRLGRAERARLRQLAPGVGVVLPNSFGAALDLALAGVPLRLGRAGRCRGPLLTHRLAEWKRSGKKGSCHQLSHYLEVVAALGYVPWNAECPALRVPQAEATAQQLGISLKPGKRWLALAPGAAYGPAKQWPAERFAEVAAWWRQQGGQTVIVGTPKERTVAAVIAQALPGSLNLTGYTSLAELLAVLTVVNAVVANDSGVMHLAAALGKPGVALFGSTDPVATGPIGGRWIVVQDPLDCAPCFQRTCPLGSSSCLCLERITGKRVCEALAALLG